VGSDHCPLLLDDGTKIDQFKRGFRFEPAWLSQPNFKKNLTEKWTKRRDEGIQDFWKRLKKELRQLNKSMGANLDGEIKRRKTRMLQDIKWLDDKVETMALDEEGWRLRYKLEKELEEIYTYEESSERDVVKDGSCKGMLTHIFHIIANGRRRKCTIHSLETEEGNF
jgi:L-rhamnose isomerase